MSARVRGFLQRWLVFLGALVAWELGARAAGTVYFPPPSTIVPTGVDLWFSGPANHLFLADTVFEDILPSLTRLLTGWVIAVVLGIAFGTALGRSRTGMDYVGPLFAFFRAIPPPALIPVFIVLVGIDTEMRLATIVFGAIWPVLLNTVDGVRSVNQVQTDTARSFRTPRSQWVGMVVLPAALPKIFAGLRLSLSIAVILMVISELVGGPGGIGDRLIFAQQAFDFPKMWTWIALLGILGYGLNTALLAVERRVLRWQPTQESQHRTAPAGG